ncbi:hypothetical protein GW17_00015580 [Ensete ventricosum]|nr:hypothetical protein GW17_00015580 [Ensete ventricosum]RZS11809.1 hypothetical protein BHM03_00043176 [Ensete ventricosum]
MEAEGELGSIPRSIRHRTPRSLENRFRGIDEASTAAAVLMVLLRRLQEPASGRKRRGGSVFRRKSGSLTREKDWILWRGEEKGETFEEKSRS